MSLKRLIKEHLPLFILDPALKLRSWMRYRALRHASTEEKFTHIKRENLWGSGESISGIGSEMSYTQPIRQRLPQILDELQIKSILDAPCGDFHWMQHVEIGSRPYFGVDIVRDLIEQNQAKYGNPQRVFRHVDIIHDELPPVDFILCRDCFIHLSNRDVLATLKNFQRTGARYLMTTTYPDQTRNLDIVTASFRQMNLELKPFNLPRPLELIYEAEDHGFKKHVGLWRLDQLDLP